MGCKGWFMKNESMKCMELVLVRDLCGTFCFSMQFVIFIELVGTLVLPAAISFTIYVIVYAIISTPTPVMSLVLLAIIFGLPGALIFCKNQNRRKIRNEQWKDKIAFT